MATKLKQVHEEATAHAGGDALVRCKMLERQVADQSLQVLIPLVPAYQMSANFSAKNKQFEPMGFCCDHIQFT